MRVLGVERVKGDETHENGNFERRRVLENSYANVSDFFFVNLILRFICFLSKSFTILEAFQNLGSKRDCYSFMFVKVLCGALSHNNIVRKFVVLWA
jgi:hypothetical protein